MYIYEGYSKGKANISFNIANCEKINITVTSLLWSDLEHDVMLFANWYSLSSSLYLISPQFTCFYFDLTNI